MKKIFFTGIFLIYIFCSYGQNTNDSIEIKKTIGAVFRQNGKKLTVGQLVEIIKSNPEAYKEMKIAQNNYAVGLVFGGAGGFMVGWPLGTAAAGGKANWTMAAVGAGLIVISIPFSSASNKHAKNAVRIYNNGLRQTTGFNRVDFKVGLTYNGIGIKMTF